MMTTVRLCPLFVGLLALTCVWAQCSTNPDCLNGGTCTSSQCDCAPTFGGRTCNFVSNDISINTPYAAVGASSSYVYYVVQDAVPASLYLSNPVRVTATLSNMDQTSSTYDMYIKINCGCVNGYPTTSHYDFYGDLKVSYLNTDTATFRCTSCTSANGQPTIGVYTYSSGADFTITVTYTDACSSRGTYTGGECVCNAGFGGLSCESTVTQLTANVPVTAVLAPDSYVFFRSSPPPAGRNAYDTFFNVVSNSSACQDTITIYQTYDCGTCSNNWPVYGQSYLETDSYDPFELSYTDTDTFSQCSCGGAGITTVDTLTFSVYQEVSSLACEVKVVVSYPDYCSNHGNYASSTCTCDSGYYGPICSQASMLTNGVPVSSTAAPYAEWTYFTLNLPSNMPAASLEASITIGEYCDDSSYPFYLYSIPQCGSCTTSGTYPTTSNYEDYDSYAPYAVSWSTDESLSECGCTSVNRPDSVTFGVRIYSAKYCEYYLTAEFIDACNSHGTFTGTICNCDAGWVGDDCSAAVTSIPSNSLSLAAYTVGEYGTDYYLVGPIPQPMAVRGRLQSTSGSQLQLSYSADCGGCPLAWDTSDDWEYSSSNAWAEIFVGPGDSAWSSECGCGEYAEYVWFKVGTNVGAPYNFEILLEDPCSGGTYDPTTDHCYDCPANTAGSMCEEPNVVLQPATLAGPFTTVSSERAYFSFWVPTGLRAIFDVSTAVGTQNDFSITSSAVCANSSCTDNPADFYFYGATTTWKAGDNGATFSFNNMNPWEYSSDECQCPQATTTGFMQYVELYASTTVTAYTVQVYFEDICNNGVAHYDVDEDIFCVCDSGYSTVAGCDGTAPCCLDETDPIDLSGNTPVREQTVRIEPNEAITLEVVTGPMTLERSLFIGVREKCDDYGVDVTASPVCGTCVAPSVGSYTSFSITTCNDNVLSSDTTAACAYDEYYIFDGIQSNYESCGDTCDASSITRFGLVIESSLTLACSMEMVFAYRPYCLNQCWESNGQGVCTSFMVCECNNGLGGLDCSSPTFWWVGDNGADATTTTSINGEEVKESLGDVCGYTEGSDSPPASEMFNAATTSFTLPVGRQINSALYVSGTNKKVEITITMDDLGTGSSYSPLQGVAPGSPMKLHAFGRYVDPNEEVDNPDCSTADYGGFNVVFAPTIISSGDDWGVPGDSYVSMAVDVDATGVDAAWHQEFEFTNGVADLDSPSSFGSGSSGSGSAAGSGPTFVITLDKPVDDNLVLKMSFALDAVLSLKTDNSYGADADGYVTPLNLATKISDPTGTFMDFVVFILLVLVFGSFYLVYRKWPDKVLTFIKARILINTTVEEVEKAEAEANAAEDAAKAKDKEEEGEGEEKESTVDKIKDKVQGAVEDEAAGRAEGIVPEGKADQVEEPEPVVKPPPTPQEIALIVLVNLINMIGQMVRSFINLSMIHQSFRLYYNIRPIEIIQIEAPYIGWTLAVSNIFNWFNFAGDDLASWNCGGVLLMASPLFVVLAIGTIVIILAMDVLLMASISINKYKDKWSIFSGRGGNVLFSAVSAFLVAALFYILQIVLVTVTTVVVAVFALRRTCSATDAFFASFATILNIIIVIIGALVGFLIFSGKPTPRKGVLALGWLAIFVYLLDAIHRVVFTSFGIWTKTVQHAHEVVRRAHDFDDDEEDDDNQHEKVIEVMGKSRGLIWIIIPTTLIMSKVSEVFNAPSPFIFDPKIQLETPLYLRLVKWIFNSTTLLLVLLTALFPSVGLFIVMILSHFPLFGIMTFFDTVGATMLDGWKAVEAKTRKEGGTAGNLPIPKIPFVCD